MLYCIIVDDCKHLETYLGIVSWLSHLLFVSHVLALWECLKLHHEDNVTRDTYQLSWPVTQPWGHPSQTRAQFLPQSLGKVTDRCGRHEITGPEEEVGAVGSIFDRLTHCKPCSGSLTKHLFRMKTRCSL